MYMHVPIYIYMYTYTKNKYTARVSMLAPRTTSAFASRSTWQPVVTGLPLEMSAAREPMFAASAWDLIRARHAAAVEKPGRCRRKDCRSKRLAQHRLHRILPMRPKIMQCQVVMATLHVQLIMHCSTLSLLSSLP